MKSSTKLKTNLILMMVKNDISFFKIILLFTAGHIFLYSLFLIPNYLIIIPVINRTRC